MATRLAARRIGVRLPSPRRAPRRTPWRERCRLVVRPVREPLAYGRRTKTAGKRSRRSRSRGSASEL